MNNGLRRAGKTVFTAVVIAIGVIVGAHSAGGRAWPLRTFTASASHDDRDSAPRILDRVQHCNMPRSLAD